MNTSSNGYVLGFSVGLCIVISSALSLAAGELKSTQDAAAEFDRQKNVMLAARLFEPDSALSRADLEKRYAQNVEEHILDVRSGDLDPIKVDDFKKLRESDRKPYRLIAKVAPSGEGAEALGPAWVFPIKGPGLWSILEGYIALEADGVHVRGLTFYKHGETPGLGGECENPEWTAKWRGKSIVEGSGETTKLVSITVKKGHVDPRVPAEREHMVDGLSGSTITSNGITNFLRSDLEAYRPRLEQLWNKKGD